METLTEIEVNDTRFAIMYYLGGDWKLLAMATGIDSAASMLAFGANAPYLKDMIQPSVGPSVMSPKELELLSLLLE